MTLEILLADAHPVARLGLSTALAQIPEARVASEVGTLAEALSALTPKLGLAVIEQRLPDGDAYDFLSAVQRLAPGTVVVVTGNSNLLIEARRALAAGALAYVSKQLPVQHFVEIVGDITAGRTIEARVRTSPCALGARECRLTPRELSVLHLMAAGHSNPDIGRQLTIGTGTVRTHVSNILEKLDAIDRTDAVVTALKLGMI